MVTSYWADLPNERLIGFWRNARSARQAVSGRPQGGLRRDRAVAEPLTTLTPEQRRAVDSAAPALEIRAGAGTGKTTTLVHRLARLAGEGSAEHRLLAVTFTRDATAGLARRLGMLLGRDHQVRVSSFHAWAARELRPEEPKFLDPDEQRRIVLRALQRRPPPRSFSFAIGAGGGEDVTARVLSFLSYARNAEVTVGQAILQQYPGLATWQAELESVSEHYHEAKRGRLDFDDLLILFRDRLKRSRAFREEVAGRLDHLAVDEYQDVNRAQADIVRLLTAKTGALPVTVVGDPRQSIYGFRGAAPTHLEAFLEAYGRRGERAPLTVSFRSTRAIVAAGNAALPDAYPLRARPRAPQGAAPIVVGHEDGQAEARAVVDHLAALLEAGAQPEDVTVLVRARSLATRYTEEMLELRDDALRRVGVRTIHAAKGLEWDHVVLLGAREGGLPSEHALRAPPDAQKALLEEERRLLYVAVTRARKTLMVTYPKTPSRFLAPLTVGEKMAPQAK